MSGNAAFVGALAHIGFDEERRAMLAHVELPIQDFDPFYKGVGLPPRPSHRDDPAQARAVALLACRVPRHPERDADVLAEAAIALMLRLFDEKALTRRPANAAALARALFSGQVRCPDPRGSRRLMAYDLVRQKHPGAPCAVGARVRHTGTGRMGNVVPPRAGDAGVRVRFDGEAFPKDCAPGAIAYLDDAPPPATPWVAR